MPSTPLPHADFFDQVEPLDTALEQAASLFSPAPALNASLPSLMMWQDQFAYALARKGNDFFILALYGSNVYFPVPPKPFTQETLRVAFGFMEKVNGPGPGISRIEGLTEDQKEQAKEWRYQVRTLSTEYLYDRNQLSGLHGDSYRAKRAEVNHLLKNHAVILRPYRVSDLKTCGELFELWKTQRLPSLEGEMGERMLRAAQKAHFRILHQGAHWGMDAWVVLLDGRLAAYSAGAALNGSTYGIYLEVTDLTIKGLSTYIFASICRQLEVYPFINTGDAEGLPRLAESKEHWHPVQHLALFAVDPMPHGTERNPTP